MTIRSATLKDYSDIIKIYKPIWRRKDECFGLVNAGLQVGERLGLESAIVSLMVEFGLKYLSTDGCKN